MAFKFTDTVQERLDEGAQELQALRNKLEDGLQTYNEAVRAARSQLQRVVEPYEAKALQLHDILEEIKNDAEDAFDAQSDDWKESDDGEATQVWIDAIDEAMTSLEDPLNLPDVEELDVEIVLPEDLSEIIDKLDVEPEK